MSTSRKLNNPHIYYGFFAGVDANNPSTVVVRADNPDRHLNMSTSDDVHLRIQCESEGRALAVADLLHGVLANVVEYAERLGRRAGASRALEDVHLALSITTDEVESTPESMLRPSGEEPKE